MKVEAWFTRHFMQYLTANLDDLNKIINLKNEVKARIIKENLNIWLYDYPSDTLLETDLKNGYGRIIKDNDRVIAYASCHLTESEYSQSAFCYEKLYTFSRLMVADTYLKKGIGSYLIKMMLEEFKSKTKGFGIIVDECNIKAINLYKSLGFRFESYTKEVFGTFLTYTYYYENSFTDDLNYELAKLSDYKHQQFVKKLYNTKYKILGVRMPLLRNFSKNLDLNYIDKINFNSIETLLLGSILLRRVKNKNIIIKYLNKILPYIDSWAITDSLASNLVIISKEQEKYFNYLEELIDSNKEYYVRLAISILIFQCKKLELYAKIYRLIDKVKINTYYVNMAIAWLLNNMAFNDQYVFTYIKKLNGDINKMFLQKRRDSLRERKIK